MVLDIRCSQHNFLVVTYNPRFLHNFHTPAISLTQWSLPACFSSSAILPLCSPLRAFRGKWNSSVWTDFAEAPSCQAGLLHWAQKNALTLSLTPGHLLLLCTPPPNGNNFSTYSNSTHPEGLAQVLPLPWNYQPSQFPLFWVPTVLIIWTTQSGIYKASLQATNIHSITSGLYILSWVPTSPALLLWEAPFSSPSQGLPSPLNREALIQWLKPLKSGCRGWKPGFSTLPAVVQARLVASLCLSFRRYKMVLIPAPTVYVLCKD